MYKIKKINILSLAYSVTLIYLIFGLLSAIFIAVLKITKLNFPGSQNLILLTYQQIILLYPVAYAVGGFAVAITAGYIYNQVSRLTGGVSVKLEKESDSKIMKFFKK